MDKLFAIFEYGCPKTYGIADGFGHTMAAFGIVLTQCLGLAVIAWGSTSITIWQWSSLPFVIIAAAVLGAMVLILRAKLTAPETGEYERFFSVGTSMFTRWILVLSVFLYISVAGLAANGQLPGQIEPDKLVQYKFKNFDVDGLRIEYPLGDQLKGKESELALFVLLDKEMSSNFHVAPSLWIEGKKAAIFAKDNEIVDEKPILSLAGRFNPRDPKSSTPRAFAMDFVNLQVGKKNVLRLLLKPNEKAIDGMNRSEISDFLDETQKKIENGSIRVIP